jgi:type IV secretory pathway TrbF-like protein
MFHKSKNSKPNIDEAVKNMGNAPLPAYREAQAKFFEIYGSSKVESSRWFMFSILLMFVVMILGAAIYQILPLKTSIPYMVTMSRDKGVSAQIVDAKTYKPDENVKIYFLSKFIENMRSLDPYQTQKNLKAAFAVTRDKASKEFTDYMQTEKPIERMVADKSLIRTIKFISVNPGSTENIAFIRTSEVERTGALETSKTYMFTLHYDFVVPTTAEEIQKNPAGIFITHFDKREELGNN